MLQKHFVTTDLVMESKFSAVCFTKLLLYMVHINILPTPSCHRKARVNSVTLQLGFYSLGQLYTKPEQLLNTEDTASNTVYF